MADVTPVNGSINLGRQGENIVTRVLLPLSDIRSGDGYAVLFHQRSVDDSPYPVAVEEDGDTLIWTVTDADTAVAGRGKAEMRWIGSQGELAKSQVYKTYVAAALEIPEEVPSGYQKYVDAVAENAKDAKDAAAESRAIYGQVLNSQKKIDETYNATVAAKVKAEEAQEKAELAANGIGTAKDDAAASAETAKGAAIAAKQAAQEAKAAKTGAVEAKTGAETAQGKAEEAARGVAADREQIGANKGGLEAAQQELAATKQQLAETKAALATTQEDLKKAQRAIQFQAELNKGQTWDFEEDTQEAYQRQVPSGAKAGAVMAVGGKTVGWNQLCKNAELASLDGFIEAGLTVLTVADGIITANCNGPNPGAKSSDDNCIATINHYYYLATTAKIEAGTRYYAPYCNSNVFNVDPRATGTGAFVRSSVIAKAIKSGPAKIGSRIATTDSGNYIGILQMKHPVFIDLTLLYGPGNEPTDTSDPRIAQIEAYAAAHPEYNAGELISALVDEVRVRGRNLIDDTAPDNIINYNNRTTYVYDNGVHKFSGYQLAQQIDTSFGAQYSVRVEAGKIYRLSFDALLKNAVIPIYISKSLGRASFYLMQADGSAITISETRVNFGNSGAWNRLSCTFAATLTGNATLFMTVDSPDFYGVGSACWYKNIQFTAADITAYAPYHDPALYFIPSAVQALPGYGWSAGSVSNTIERTENGWQYVQRVGSVDLGTLDYTKEENTFRAKIQDMQIVSTDVPFNGRCKSFISIRYRDSWNFDGTMSQDSSKRLVLIHSGYSNIASFLSYVRGTPLYYELATPITTDITDLMGDSLAPFAVEAGGSITLHHPKADEGFAIDVPANIQYITKLSEVSSNG